MCSTGAVYECAGSCSTPDSRYSACFSPATTNGWSDLAAFSHLYPIFCEDEMRRVGDPCSSDGDCRPSLDGVRLVCGEDDSCSGAPRPSAPDLYGQQCGLDSEQVPQNSNDSVTEGVLCDWCHVVREPGEECVRQACTIACQLDEDCPEGSVCLCFEDQFPTQFCVQTDDRSTPTNWLMCPD